MECGTLKLKKELKSKRFCIFFPKNVSLKYFKDNGGNIYVHHPNYDNLYILATEKNITEINKH